MSQLDVVQLGCLDTSLFLTALFPGDPHAARCARLIRALEEGTAEGWLDPLAVHELSYAAQRTRRFASPRQIQEYVVSIVKMEGLQAEDKIGLIEALARWGTQGMSFVDAWLAVQAKRRGIPVCSVNARDFPEHENTFLTAQL